MWNPFKIFKATKIVCARGGTDHYTYQETTNAMQEINGQMMFPSNIRLRKQFVLSHERGIDVALGRADKDADYQSREIIPRITNQEFMESLPKNTVGASYGHLIKQWSFFELWERRLTETQAAMPANQFGKDWVRFVWGNVSRHIFLSHDFWHVMFRYDTSRLGEACIMAITHSAIKHTGPWWISHAIAAKMSWERKSLLPWKAVREAVKLGNAVRRDFWYLNPLEVIEQDVEQAREAYNIGVCEAFIKYNNTFKEEFRNDSVHPEYNDWKIEKLVAQEI